MKKLLTFASAAVMAVSLTLSVSANTVFYKDFTDGTLEPWIENSTDICSHEFTDTGVRLYDLEQNFTSYVFPIEATGIELDSDKYYVVTFEGKVNVDNPGSKEMIIQLFGETLFESDDWINIRTIDGREVNDELAYPVNEDGTFKCVGLITPDDISLANRNAITKLCVWGKYGNHPTDYEVYYVKVEEADANGNPIGGAEETTEPTTTTETAAEGAKTSAKTGVESVAVITGVSLLTVGAVIISRKKK